MERLSRYRILQIVFVIVFIISVLVIWNLVRTQSVQVPSISELFDRELESMPTAVIPTATSVPLQPTTSDTIDPQNFTYYEVQSGDTLADIASEFDVTVSTIQQANGLESIDIKVDDVLAIPTDGAFSLVGVAATVESVSATQVAIVGQATAVSATAEANESNISYLATREQALVATVDANSIKIEVLADVETQTNQETNWLGVLTGPILTSILAFGGFFTSTWFEWRDDKREQSSTNADIERQKLEAELRLLNLQVKEKERELIRRHRAEQENKS